jgi:hypothetical protein
MSTTRRDMIKTLAALPLLRLPGTDPDLILYNGLIHTVQPGNPQVTAVAVRDGRFLAVGTDREILALAGKKTRRVDLARQRVFPGFIDAHAHPWASGLDQLKNVACDKTSIEEILAALRARAAETPPGGWVRGYLYDDGKTPRPLTRADLDAAVPDHPVIVQHRGGHTAYVNSLALQAAGATAATPDPPGGRFEHGPDGELNGRVADKAMDAVASKMPEVLTRDDHRRGIALISKLYASYGVTSVARPMRVPMDCRASRMRANRASCCFAPTATWMSPTWTAISRPACTPDSATPWCASAASSSTRTVRFPSGQRGWPNPTSDCRITSASRAAPGRVCTRTHARRGWPGFNWRLTPTANMPSTACSAFTSSCRKRRRAATRAFGSSTARW